MKKAIIAVVWFMLIVRIMSLCSKEELSAILNWKSWTEQLNLKYWESKIFSRERWCYPNSLNPSYSKNLRFISSDKAELSSISSSHLNLSSHSQCGNQTLNFSSAGKNMTISQLSILPRTIWWYKINTEDVASNKLQIHLSNLVTLNKIFQ